MEILDAWSGNFGETAERYTVGGIRRSGAVKSGVGKCVEL
jgi:hypothetical protein